MRNRMVALVTAMLLATTCGQLAEAQAPRPNVLLIMVDDLGFSDIGCYGSEIPTPNLDSLANEGVRFSQFYNTAKCHSSRVSLLTGQYCIAAGDTSLSHAVTSAEVLGKAGYFTAMTGKWHLKKQPTDFGFQKYFGHLSGACNYFSGDGTFRLNGQPWKVPGSGFYTTVANVDYSLKFLQQARETGKPWFLYVAFNAPHAPLHALPEDYARHQGKYKQGWDVVRDARIARQKQLGVLPASLKPSPRPEHIPAWKDLKPWQRDYEVNRMVTLAAMIDRVDREIGRLIKDLKKNKELENTFILFVSDNGACPYDRKPAKLNIKPTNAGASYGDSTGWAWARNSPFRYYKQNQFEGGISTPAIVHWPAGLKVDQGSVIDQPAHLIDVLPTMADIAKADIPGAETDTQQGRELRPVSGVSLKPMLEGRQLKSRPPIHLLFSSDRGLRDGDWKLVSFQGQAWELYNIATDRSELNNLAREEPARLKRMIATWNVMTKDVLHSPGKVKEPKPTVLPHRHREWTNFSAEPRDDQRKRRAPARIRARKNTTMQIAGNELRLKFTGEDPGIALDLRNRSIPAGPYLIEFKLQSKSRGGDSPAGEIFFTTDARTSLPKGSRINFVVKPGEDNWQNISLQLGEKGKRLHQIRIDIGNGPGAATIADLRLLDSGRKAIITWPAKAASQKK